MAMKRTILRVVSCVLVLVVAASCGGRTKEEIVQKARDVSTRAELEKALGKPDDIAKLGPVEQWTYKASNGKVVFVIFGEQVTLQATGGSEKEQ